MALWPSKIGEEYLIQMPRNLTDKQELFAQHFALHDNASDAYRYAFSTENMKSVTVNNNAYQVKNTPKVAARIDELKAEIQAKAKEKFDLTADELLNHFKEIAFMDFGDFFDWCGNTVTLKAKDELTKLQRQMITSIKQTKGNVESIDVTFVSKDRALDRLATYFNLDNITVDATEDLKALMKKEADDFDAKFEAFKTALRSKIQEENTIQ